VRPAAPSPSLAEAADDAAFADFTSAASTTPAAPSASASRIRKRASRASGLRRTLIPILLTTGVMTIVTGAMRWLVDEAAPLARIPPWTAIAAVVMGVVLIALAVMNMLQVRNESLKSIA
jgi:hypothetical protein